MRDVDHPYVRVLADMYHVCKEKEDFANVVRAGKDLRHVHIAEPEVRTIPSFNDSFDYSTFHAALQAAGYNARISLEGKLKGEDMRGEWTEALAVLKKNFN